MLRNRVLIAGIIFCLLFTGIVFILISDQHNLFSSLPDHNSSVSRSLEQLEPTDKSDVHSFPTVPVAVHPSNESTRILGTGTIVFEDIEGGFFGVLSDEGQRFLPRELPEGLRVNGTPVSFSFSTVTDRVTSFMWGEPVDVISIQAIPATRSIRSALPLIEYERAGGVSGSYESLFIYPDGRGEVSKWNMVERITLEKSDINRLIQATNISGLSDLKNEYLPAGPSPSAITYTITLDNKSVKATAEDMPAQLKPLLTLLNSILESNAISPVLANMTLEGTVWNLAGFTRSDGIPVVLPNNSRISVYFEKGNEINGSTGCSPYSAPYNQSGKNITFGPVRITKAACMEPGAGEVETAYLDLLGKVAYVAGKQKSLILADNNNTTLLIFNQVNSGPGIS